MDLHAAETLANELIEQYLKDVDIRWHFGWNRRKKAYGLCNHEKHCIFLSRYSTLTESEYSVRQTLLHEIAHALAGPGLGHGRVWKIIALNIGVENPASTKVAENPHAGPAPKWVMVLENEIVARYHRRPGPRKFTHVQDMFISGRKAETKGKLRLIPYTTYIAELMQREGSLR